MSILASMDPDGRARNGERELVVEPAVRHLEPRGMSPHAKVLAGRGEPGHHVVRVLRDVIWRTPPEITPGLRVRRREPVPAPNSLGCRKTPPA